MNCVSWAVFQGFDGRVSDVLVGVCPVVEQDAVKNKYVAREGQE